MPRVLLPQYPQSPYQPKEFPCASSPIHDYKIVCNAHEGTVVKLWQKFGLVHQFCPEKLCMRTNYECVYNLGNDCVRCQYCKTDFPSRPEALKGLTGSHQSLFERLFIFASGDSSNEFLHNFIGIILTSFQHFKMTCSNFHIMISFFFVFL